LNPTNKKSKVAINFLSLFFILLMMGCQHQSKIQPSSGHIKNNEEVISEVLLPIEVPKPNKPFINLPIPKYKLKEPTYSVVVNVVPVK
jgi:general secretion pathway protein D